MSNIDTLLHEAHANHRQGRLDDAERLYREILQKNQQHSEVQYLYGALNMQLGNLKKAIEHSKKALNLKPGHTGALSNLGFAYTESGDIDQALDCYKQALDSDPECGEAHYNLARLLQTRGHLEKAIKHFKKSIEARPDHYLSYAYLADACLKTEDYAGALQYFEKGMELRPDEAETHHNVSFVLRKLGRLQEALASSMKATTLMPKYKLAHNTQGLIYEGLGKVDEAEACYQIALSLDPEYVDALSNLASLFRENERHEESIALLEKAQSINPGHLETQNNLGASYRELGKLDLAREHYLRALEINPDYFESQGNLAEVYFWLGEYERAIRMADKIIAVHPEQKEILWNRSFSYLCHGDLRKGWEDYENRRFIKSNSVRKFPYPEWDGSSLKGRTILVHAEQGLGDEILFASCYQDVIAEANRVIIDCDPRLVCLFERSFPQALVYGGRPGTDFEAINKLGAVDCQIVAGSLPRFTRPGIDSFPDRKNFLVPDPACASKFRERLKGLGEGLKVGIAWRSSRRTATRNHSYTNLHDWQPILSVPGIQLVSLQYDECQDELQAFQDQYGVTIHNWEDIDQYNDLDGVAALVSALDLVVCVNISVASFAGALGTPVWKLSIPNDWTALGQNSSPWYPSMRNFNQKHFGEWSEVISNIATALDTLVNRKNCEKSEPVATGDISAHDEPIIEAQDESQNKGDTLTLKQCRDGLVLFDRDDHSAGLALEHYGEYAWSEKNILQQLLHEGNVVLEVDAGFGINTLKFSQLVGPSGIVMSLEPQRLLFQRLCANLALNAIDNVHACQVGVSGKQTGDHLTAADIAGHVEIDELGIAACDLLCVNVPAAAIDIMAGATDTIARYKPFIYIRGVSESPHELQRHIEGLGYSSLLYEVNLYNPDNFQENAERIPGHDILRCLLGIPTGH